MDQFDEDRAESVSFGYLCVKEKDKGNVSESNPIPVKGARVNNLRNIDVKTPRGKLVVITGLSGSGRSSLALDTLYAEGQRRYVENLSAYARQFLGRMNKPGCDCTKGISPAVAIKQKVNTRNPRSTVGISTEIYECLCLLYAHVGKMISPVSGTEVKGHQVSDIIEKVARYPEGTRFIVFAPVVLPEDRDVREQLEILRKEGYARLSVNGTVYRISEVLTSKELLSYPIELLVDHLAASDDRALENRLADPTEAAFFESHGTCLIHIYTEEGVVVRGFSKKFEADGMISEEPTDMMSSFNNPLSTYPTCKGFGKILGIDKNLAVPDKSLSVYQGTMVCWKDEAMEEWLRGFIVEGEKYSFPIHRPYYDLTQKKKNLLWHGAGGLHGTDDFFKFVEENLYKIQYRAVQTRYRGKTTCLICKGSRLRPEALYVQVGGKSIAELVTMPVSETKVFFDQLELDETGAAVARRLFMEINNRLQFLLDMGLGYLALDRLPVSLSGGESQHTNLATSLGGSLVSSLYILSELSIGLYSRDTDLLIKVSRHSQASRNTVVVVEYDEEIIRAADYIIDIGPKAGRLGDEVTYQGDVNSLRKYTDNHTVRYLTGEDRVEIPPYRRPWNNYIEVTGIRKNNLKGVDVKFPLNVMTMVTGVNGSGKNSLIRNIFYEGVKRHSDDAAHLTVDCSGISGDLNMIQTIEFIDQNSIRESSRSNPVTYIDAYDEIRELFGEQPLTKRVGYNAAYFSSNKEGGRCEEYKGEGKITVEMQFVADIILECEACRGKRFKRDILDIEYQGANIYDVLEMIVNQAIEFFEEGSNSQEKKIVKRLKPLQDVGLGYIKLGQTSSALSGGENQRVELAYYLDRERQQSTLFVFDEPTTGLRFHDIKTLLRVFNTLIEKGHSVVIIEHSMDMIKCANYAIDLGSEGGEAGGQLVCTNTLEEIAAYETSYTGRFLEGKL